MAIAHTIMMPGKEVHDRQGQLHLMFCAEKLCMLAVAAAARASRQCASGRTASTANAQICSGSQTWHDELEA